MKQVQFWLMAVLVALLVTWACLAIKMCDEQARLERIENHSEITGIDTAE